MQHGSGCSRSRSPQFLQPSAPPPLPGGAGPGRRRRRSITTAMTLFSTSGRTRLSGMLLEHLRARSALSSSALRGGERGRTSAGRATTLATTSPMPMATRCSASAARPSAGPAGPGPASSAPGRPPERSAAGRRRPAAAGSACWEGPSTPPAAPATGRWPPRPTSRAESGSRAACASTTGARPAKVAGPGRRGRKGLPEVPPSRIGCLVRGEAGSSDRGDVNHGLRTGTDGGTGNGSVMLDFRRIGLLTKWEEGDERRDSPDAEEGPENGTGSGPFRPPLIRPLRCPSPAFNHSVRNSQDEAAKRIRKRSPASARRASFRMRVTRRSGPAD